MIEGIRKTQMLYEGKAKQVFETENEDLLVVKYKDDATAFNNQKKGQISRKGELNNEISRLIFEYLEIRGIRNHFVEKIDERQQLVKRVEIIPLEVITRNYVAGSMADRLGLEEGMKSPVTILDLCYKKDALGDPLINDHHAVCLGLATYGELEEIYSITAKINEILTDLFDRAGVILADFKIEFGRLPSGEIILADEISPDTCRLWDKDTMKKLDKDRFRRDLGEVTQAYEEICSRLKEVLK